MATFKKKSMRLNEMLENKLVKEGDLLRYKSKQQELLAIGFAQEGGIRVPNVSGLLGFTGFEGLTKSNYHRPCQFTYAPNSISLQGLVNEGADTEPETKGAAAKVWGLTHKRQPATAGHTVALEDEHDEFCRVCWSGGDLICCETCPAVFHPACLGLSAVPEEDEWFCPLCRCACCGFGGFTDDVEDTRREQVCWVDPPSGESNAPAWTGFDFGDGDASVIVPAMDFDRLWPKLAPRIPAPDDSSLPAPKVELPEQEIAPADLLPLPEPSQADKATDGPPELSQAAKPVENRTMALPKAASASRQAADHVPLRIMQDADGVLPTGILEVLDLEKYVEIARAEEGQRSNVLVEVLEADFPSAQGSAAKAQRLRSVWATMFPSQDMKMYAPVRSAAIRHIADAVRDIARQRREFTVAHVAAPAQPPLGAASQPVPIVAPAVVTEPSIDPVRVVIQSDQTAVGTGAAQPDLEKICMLAASAASSENELLITLEVMFPSAVGSAKKAKPIRDLWGIIFPSAEFMKSRSAAIPALAHELWQRAHPAPPAPPTQPTPPTNSIMGALLLAHGGTPPGLTGPSPGSAKATGLAALVPLGASPAAEAGSAGDAVDVTAKAPGSAVASKKKVSGSKSQRKKGGIKPEQNDGPAGLELRAERVAGDAEDLADGAEELAKDTKIPAEEAKEVKGSRKLKKGSDGKSGEGQLALKTVTENGSKGKVAKAATAAPPRFSRHRSDTLDNAIASTSSPVDSERRKRRKVVISDDAPPAEAGSNGKQVTAVNKDSNGIAMVAEEAAIGNGGKLHETLPHETLPAKLRHKAARLGKCAAPVNKKPAGVSSSATVALPAQEAEKVAPGIQKAAKKVQPASKKVQPAEKAPRVRKQPSPKKVDLGTVAKGSPISKSEQEDLDHALALSLSAAPTARSTRAALAVAEDTTKSSVPAGPSSKRQKIAKEPVTRPKLGKGIASPSGKAASKPAKLSSKQKIPQTDGPSDDPESEDLELAEDWATGLLEVNEAHVVMEERTGPTGVQPPEVAAGVDSTLPAKEDNVGGGLPETGNSERPVEPTVENSLPETGESGRPVESAAGTGIGEESALGAAPARDGETEPLSMGTPELAVDSKEEGAGTAHNDEAQPPLPGSTMESASQQDDKAAGSEPVPTESVQGDATGGPQEAVELLEKQEEEAAQVKEEEEVVIPPVDTAVEPLPVDDMDLRPMLRDSQPTGQEAAAVSCVACGRRVHRGCLPLAHQGLESVWFCSLACKEANRRVAQLAAQGLMRASPKLHGVCLAWQLISGAAVSSPQDCRGHAPRLDDVAREQLRVVLIAARHLLAETCGPLTDSRSGADLLPQMLKGAMVLPGSTLRHGGADLTGFHTALLWAGSAIVCVGLVRVLGASVAEIVVLTTRPEVQGLGLGRLLLRQLEAALIRCGVKLAIMPAIPLPPMPAPTAAEEIAASTSIQEEPTSLALVNGKPHDDGGSTVPASDAQAEKESGSAAYPPLAGSYGWGLGARYSLASREQMQELVVLPVLVLPGTPVLAKPLSPDTLTTVEEHGEKASSGLHFGKHANPAPVVQAKLLVAH